MQKETGDMLKIMYFLLWKILQNKTPKDYVNYRKKLFC